MNGAAEYTQTQKNGTFLRDACAQAGKASHRSSPCCYCLAKPYSKRFVN